MTLDVHASTALDDDLSQSGTQTGTFYSREGCRPKTLAFVGELTVSVAKPMDG